MANFIHFRTPLFPTIRQASLEGQHTSSLLQRTLCTYHPPAQTTAQPVQWWHLKQLVGTVGQQRTFIRAFAQSGVVGARVPPFMVSLITQHRVTSHSKVIILNRIQ